MKKLTLLLLFFIPLSLCAQQPATKASDVIKSLEKKKRMTENSLIKNIPFKNIGPTVMSGRVVDVSVNPNNTAEFYVGYASGGLWYTNNNGTTFTPVMDNSPTQNIGDIAVDWKNGTIWVGTGEKNSSRSSYAGIGMLKSTDQGKTWEHVGLEDSHHISRIVINPNNPDEVVVGVIGHLYSSNEERGIYKTTNGGKSWKKTLHINNDTGIIDVVAAPENANIMYAASWERERKAWNFDGDGKNSAIYKSTDGGNNWSIVSKNNGFRNGDGVGRIGIAVYDANTVYVLHDSQFRRKAQENKSSNSNQLTKDDFKSMSKNDFLNLSDAKLNGYLRSNRFERKYNAKSTKQMVSEGTIKPVDFARYLENENAVTFPTPVEGAEVFLTTNGGKSWKKTHTGNIEGLYSSYGYYFGEIRVDPQDKNGIYVLGVPILKSKDGGKTFTSISAENVHSDHQALWVNPNKKGHLLNGNDGGLNLSYDDGESWIKLNNASVGQFYSVYADKQKPYHVYGGLQDNGVWTAVHTARMDKRWKQSGQNPYQSIMGGDGMQVQVDERNQNIVFTGLQYGVYYRINRETGARKFIQPSHTLGESPYRFNWQTPIHLSRHNEDILYFGGNKLHRSFDQGDNWETISGDLTNGGRKGNVNYGTLTTISESPFQFGLLYTGSDDGRVSVSKNGGNSWETISTSFPKELWVTRVIASQHKKERVYVTLNGYRWDDFTPYVYVSDDYGKTWKNISGNIPASPVNVIKEDPTSPNILYVGTDNGLYTTLNAGKEWHIFDGGLPNVAVHDLVIQEEAKHLVIGTHGRGIYIADISPIQQMTPALLQKDAYVFPIENVRRSWRWGSSRADWSPAFTPSIQIPFYADGNKRLSVQIYHKDVLVNTLYARANKGYNEISYDLTFDQPGLKAFNKANEKMKVAKSQNNAYYLPKGDYTVKIGRNAVGKFSVK